MTAVFHCFTILTLHRLSPVSLSSPVSRLALDSSLDACPPSPAEIDASFASTTPPPEEDEDEEVQRQTRPATPEEMIEIEALAQKTATLQDELKLIIERVVGGRSKELAGLKAQLLDRMLTHNLTEVWVRGRPPIEVVIKNERKSSKKAIIAALTKMHGGDTKKAAAEANTLWNTIPQTKKPTLSIPEASAPDIQSPY